MSLSKQSLSEINIMLNKDVEFLERRKFSTLTVDEIYFIKKIIIMTTRYGKAILARLHDKTNNVTFETFLPKHVLETLSEYTIEIMNKSDKYTLTYLGHSSQVFSGGKTRKLLNFGSLE
jgi:hypothetical protein